MAENKTQLGGTAQGFGEDRRERLPIPDRAAMSEAQCAAADAIINGPRKAIFGPFVPLLRTPVLMERIGKLGEALRFEGSLSDAVRELVICVVSRETDNQFEWQTHAPLAIKAGVAPAVIRALEQGRVPLGLAGDLGCAVGFALELLARNGVSEDSYAEAVACFGESGVVELTSLIGYFAMICWVMNVARTPGPAGSSTPGMQALPA